MNNRQEADTETNADQAPKIPDRLHEEAGNEYLEQIKAGYSGFFIEWISLGQVSSPAI